MKHFYAVITLCVFTVFGMKAQTQITISDPDTWTTSQLSKYVGQTVTFLTPLYVTNNYNYTSGRLSVSPHRIYSPTNQAVPLTNAYSDIVRLNNNSEMTLSGISDYHRMGERIIGLTCKVNSTTSLTAVGTVKFAGNTRDDMRATTPDMLVDSKGTHTLLVCAFNLEYYLVENLGTGYGPDDEYESARQHKKIMDALSRIKADIFGFVEIERGQAALRKIAQSLSATTGKTYDFINDGGSSYSSYTKSGYVYCSSTVEPVGNMRANDAQVSNRKMMQAFREKSSGEIFIFSINHFKAKSGTATGLNADQGDGQGTFNYTRTLEAQSVLAQYQTNTTYYGDDDILIMGDLNAYAKEDPIRTLTENGMTDLHRYFHADSAYSYVYHNQAGYLDHALANSTLLPQITGMSAYHINSDEHDRFTYDKSTDETMFRSSDHDPVLVGLRLNASYVEPDNHINNFEVITEGTTPRILHAMGGYYLIHNINGLCQLQGTISNDDFHISTPLPAGLYIVTVYHNGETKTFKLIVR
ncbi:MAG: endonuclease/exonuclease/phosphatase family protein [Paludibacteraceae bacterium]|nr:endonuclease/exonuclease/phosphatase family protein [Paludibacteraceae bacterium]